MRPLPLTLAAVVVALPFAAARADSIPRPDVDYSITYDVSPSGRVVTMAKHGSVTRIDTERRGQPVVALIDTTTRTVTTLIDQPEKVAMVMDLNGMRRGPAALPMDADVKMNETGTATVAGVPCTTYDFVTTAQGKTATGTLCLTTEDVLLASTTTVGDKVQSLIARQVDISPQDPGHFVVPGGYRRTTVDEMSRQPGPAPVTQ